MWLRILSKIGNSNCVVLPIQLLRGTGWKRGDYLQISVLEINKILLEKVDITKIPDELLKAVKELPTIKYE